MSTAPAGIPSDPSQRTSLPSGTLAVLAASALGGFLVSRLGKAPLLLAAAAAAYALLQQNKPATPTVAPLPPAPPPEIPPQSQIEQWRALLLTRDAPAPLPDLSSPLVATRTPDNAYQPQSLLLDDVEEAALFPPDIDSFAGLTEPLPQQAPAYFAPNEHWSAPFTPVTPAPALPPAVTDAAWTLGMQPLPPLNEITSTPSALLASSMFFTAPIQQDALAPPTAFSLPVFEGAAFPDEINVASPSEPWAVEPLVHLTPTLPIHLPPKPVNEPPPL